MTTAEPVSAAQKPHMDCTIVVPAYNAAAFIEQTIESALAQRPDDPPVIIVVDDGSKDNTADLVRQYDRVRLIQQVNGGRAAACNTGLHAAETTYVKFLDADDTLLPGAIEAHIAAFEAHPDAVMVYGSNHLIDENNKRLASRMQKPFETRDIERIATSVTPCGSQVLYKREAVEAVGGFDAGLRVSEDVDMSLRLPEVGSIVCHGEFVMNYRSHGAQLTKNPSGICQTHLRVIDRIIGPGGPRADVAMQKRVNAKWQRFYGQHIPGEVAKRIIGGDFGRAGSAARVFVSCLPHSARGAAQFIQEKLAGRH